MKTENNLHNKAKFFAQYWDIPCIYNDDYTWRANETFDTVLSVFNGNLSKWYAVLTPLSQISDEDVKEVSRILNFHDGNGLIIERVSRGDKSAVEIISYDRYNDYPNEINTLKFFTDDAEFFSIDETGGVFDYDCNRILNAMDYMRSKGYALSWMDLSVDDLVEYGWVKIKE